jgi:DNA-binding IclR family transcriptional regulator
MTVQTLDRGIELLRLLAEAGAEGCRLTDLQRETGLSKPTIHRLLQTLKNHALAAQVDETKRYCLGPEIAALGWLSTRHLTRLQDYCEEDMEVLAQTTGNATFLVVPLGNETICIDRHMGSSNDVNFTIDVGVRCPLGIGATGIALLASMAPPVAEQIFETRQREFRHYPASLNDIRAAVTNARRTGYAFSDGTVLHGVRGLAISVRDSAGKVVASVGVASSSERIAGNRIPELLNSLRTRVRHIEKRLERSAHASRH